MARKTPGFLSRLRTYTGLASAGLLNLAPLGVNLKSVCSPGFNCHGCPWATTTCPIGAMAYGSAVRTLPVMTIGLVLTVGAIFGRLVCGFACPFGWFQDLLHKIPGRKFKLPRATRYIKYAALVALVLALPWALGFRSSGYLRVVESDVYLNDDWDAVVVLVTVENQGTEPVTGVEINAVYYDKSTGEKAHSTNEAFPEVSVAPGQTITLPAFEIPDLQDTVDLVLDSPQSVPGQETYYNLYYCKLCPAGTLTATLPAIASGSSGGIYGGLGGSALRLGILAAFLILMVLVSRPFCQTFCPLGAIYGLFSRFALARMSVDKNACTGCGLCEEVCPVDLDVVKEVGGAECIACGDCIKVCPQTAIARQFGPGDPAGASPQIQKGS